MTRNEAMQIAKQLLSYDEETGIFYWIVDYPRTKRKAGDEACRIGDLGYRRLKIEGVWMYGHRLAWFFKHGEVPRYIDHINMNRADNRISNLRVATNSQNQMNKGVQKCSSTGLKGVSFHKGTGKYQAKITRDGLCKHIGLFEDPQQAYQAYIKAAGEIHGEFARY